LTLLLRFFFCAVLDLPWVGVDLELTAVTPRCSLLTATAVYLLYSLVLFGSEVIKVRLLGLGISNHLGVKLEMLELLGKVFSVLLGYYLAETLVFLLLILISKQKVTLINNCVVLHLLHLTAPAFHLDVSQLLRTSDTRLHLHLAAALLSWSL
jgi:hypothetical protein